MGGKVIELNAERWACVFDEEGLCVSVSDQGRVKFDAPSPVALTTEQTMDLTIVLTHAFGDGWVKRWPKPKVV